ncbi:MAG TPA: chloride channel protein, partial [Lachnospiraceae bacterium]|nr:chloride channel protein [Lachnospiraceae bacterium]
MKKYIKICVKRAWLLLRWLILAGGMGILLGLVGGLFGKSVTWVTDFRNTHPWMLYLLPLAGLVIVGMDRLNPYKGGTNRVLESIQSHAYIPLRMAPLIVLSTVLTHACGGSAGREGAALQLGGSLGGTAGKWMKFDEYDHRLMIMCGMSAGFAALFGTPLTATVFAMEVISVGMMQYAALVPCSVAALTAKQTAELIGAYGEHFLIEQKVAFDLKNAVLVVLLAF